MTLVNNICSVAYVGDGSTTKFIVPFRFFDDEIAVYKNNTSIRYQKGSEYIIAGDGTKNNGVIAFVIAPAEGEAVTIIREVPLTQEVTFLEGEDFPASDYEYSLDRIYMAMQELKEKIDRAYILAPGSESPNDTFCKITDVYNKIEALDIFAKKDDVYVKDEVNNMIPTVKVFGQINIAPQTWSASTALEGYNFVVNLVCMGATSVMVPVVTFSAKAAATGNFAPVARSFVDTVCVYAKELPTEDVIVESVVLFEGV